MVNFVNFKFQHFAILWGWGGDGLGVPTQAYWARGDCHTFFYKMLNQKAVIKRFSFVFHMNARANTYQKNYISLRVYFSWVRSSTQLVCRRGPIHLQTKSWISFELLAHSLMRHSSSKSKAQIVPFVIWPDQEMDGKKHVRKWWPLMWKLTSNHTCTRV